MTANRIQASRLQQLAASTTSRRRSVPPSPPEPVSQSLNQRWRERPRCPAPPVTRRCRDGVVHAIVGRVLSSSSYAQFAQDERAARAHVFVSKFAGQNGPKKSYRNQFARVPMFPGRNVTFASTDLGVAPSRLSCWRRARRRQCSALRFDPANGRAFGH